MPRRAELPVVDMDQSEGPPVGYAWRRVADGWVAIYTVLERNGAPVIADIRITPEAGFEHQAPLLPDADVPPGGLTGRILRQVATGGDVIADALNPKPVPIYGPDATDPFGQGITVGGVITSAIKTPKLRYNLDSTWPVEPVELWQVEPGFSEAAVRSASQTRGYPRSDLYYAEVASRYVSLSTSGRDVIDALRDELAEQGLHYSANGVREQLRTARRRGLLTKAPAGRAGGKLTPLAIEILAQQSDA